VLKSPPGVAADDLNDDSNVCSTFSQSDACPDDRVVQYKDTADRQPSDAEGHGSRSRPRSRSPPEVSGGSWKELAQVLDRLFFWLMLTAMTSCGLIVVMAPVHKHITHSIARAPAC